MSASARDYVYTVKVKDSKKPEPVLSRSALEASRERVAKYMKVRKDGTVERKV